MFKKGLFSSAALAAGLAFGASNANAVPVVALELALLVDVSGSVDATEYALQKTGYVNAFSNPAIQNAIASLTGGIAVTYIEWSGGTQQSSEVGWTHITDTASSNAFATAINNATRNFSGLTAPGSAINFAVPLFSSNNYDAPRQVIDVSGDGTENDGADTATARNAALTAGIDAINGLAIGDIGLLSWYQTNIQGGANSFTIQANNFADFDGAVRTKIGREITGIPEPASLALLGLGLAGLGFMRRRRT